MAFDATINLGNILTVAATIVTVFVAYHRWDKKVEIRHVENKLQTNVLTTDLKRVETKVDHTNGQLGSTQSQINDLVTKVSEHLAEDRVFHEDAKRRMNRLEEKKS